MKSKLMRINMLWMLIAALFLSVSCDDDDDDTTTPAPVVLDGYYAVGTSVFTETMATAGKFGAGVIEGAGFAATPRDSMYQKFMFVSSTGNFLIKQQKGAQVITWGIQGSLTTTGDTISGTLAQNGSAISVGSDGFYFVIADLPTMKIHMLKVSSWGVIGDATPDGWGSDQDLTQVVLDKEKGEWKIEDVLMRAGSFKFRYNNQWTYVITEGAPAFTNIGGSLTDLTTGGANISMPEDKEGIYTLTLKFEFGGKFTLDTLRTATITPEVLPDSVFLVGSVNGWDNTGLYLAPIGSDKHVGYSYLFSTSEIKILVQRGSWDVTWGAGDAAGSIKKGGGNIIVGNESTFSDSAFYQIMFDLYNKTIVLTKIDGIGVIGNATLGGWDTDANLEYDKVNKKWLGSVELLGTGEYKFRANDAWDISFGGALDPLLYNGSNLVTPGAGIYNVAVDLQGQYKFSATVVQ